MSTGIVPAANYRYENLPNAVKSVHRTVKFTPINGSTFTNNSSNLIRIEIRSTGFLCGQESYLKFTLTNINGTSTAASLDNGAHGCIQRLRLLANGVVLSDINNYHQLATFLIASQGSDDYQRIMQIVGGGETTINDAVGGDGFANIPTGQPKTYSIPLISGLLNSQRYLPLGLMTGGLVLELYLEPSYYVVFKSGSAITSPTYSLSGVEYIAKIVELQDENAMNMIKSMMMSSGLQIKTDDWICHTNSIASSPNSTNVTLTIPDRSSSLKHLITLFHNSIGTFGNSALQSYKFETTQYQYRVGSQLYPIQPVTVSADNLTEAFSELMKCFNTGLFNLNSHTYLNATSFNNDSTYANYASFACAYDFENYADSEAFSGLDLSTLGLPVSFSVTLKPLVAINVNTFAHFDCVYTIDATGLINKVQ